MNYSRWKYLRSRIIIYKLLLLSVILNYIIPYKTIWLKSALKHPRVHIMLNRQTNINVMFSCLVGFNGISTSIGYLMPTPVYTYVRFGRNVHYKDSNNQLSYMHLTSLFYVWKFFFFLIWYNLRRKRRNFILFAHNCDGKKLIY